MSPAFLLVFSDPGSELSEEDFHNWYNHNHIPLRHTAPAFQNFAHWKANDSQKPSWAVSYDLASYADAQAAPYTELMAKGTDREKGVFGEIGVLEKRMYELKESPLPPPSSLFDAEKPSHYVVLVSVDVLPGGEDVFNKWYDDEHIPMLAEIPGWIRSRRFVLKDWARAGVEGRTNQQPPPKYLTVHEWDYLEQGMSLEVQKAWDTPLRSEMQKVVLNRQFRVMQNYTEPRENN